MKLFSCDIRVYATAYVKAETEKEARYIFKAMKYDAIEVSDAGGDVEICGDNFANLDADISLSPAMTIHGPDRGAPIEVVHDYGEENVE